MYTTMAQHVSGIRICRGETIEAFATTMNVMPAVVRAWEAGQDVPFQEEGRRLLALGFRCDGARFLIDGESVLRASKPDNKRAPVTREAQDVARSMDAIEDPEKRYALYLRCLEILGR